MLLAAQPPLVAMKGFIRVVVVEWRGTVWLRLVHSHSPRRVVIATDQQRLSGGVKREARKYSIIYLFIFTVAETLGTFESDRRPHSAAAHHFQLICPNFTMNLKEFVQCSVQTQLQEASPPGGGTRVKKVASFFLSLSLSVPLSDSETHKSV